MARKTKPYTNKLPAQIKHLRFVSLTVLDEEEPAEDAPVTDVVETGTILNNGGYTLAYRVYDISKDPVLRAEHDAETGILVQYAYAECHANDNFNKKSGRARATARLNHMAPGWADSFILDLPNAIDPADMISLVANTALIDLRNNEADLAEAVIESFLEEFQEALNVGSIANPMIDYLINYQGTLAIHSDALLPEESDDEDDEADISSITGTAILTDILSISELLDDLDDRLTSGAELDLASTIQEIRDRLDSVTEIVQNEILFGAESEEEDHDGDEDDGDDGEDEQDAAEEGEPALPENPNVEGEGDTSKDPSPAADNAQAQAN